MQEPIPTLIVPTLNGHKRLAKLIDSIDYPVNDLIIIDNGHSQRAAFELAHIYDNPHVFQVHTVRLPSNLGVAASWNLGIKLTPRSEYWFVVNDDVEFPPGAMAQFAAEAEAHGGVCLSSDSSRWCAFTIGQKVVETVGLFDEAFYPAYYEDVDYTRRIESILGSDVISSPGVEVLHSGSATISGGYMVQNGRTFDANRLVYENKVKTDTHDTVGWSLAARRANDWSV